MCHISRDFSDPCPQKITNEFDLFLDSLFPPHRVEDLEVLDGLERLHMLLELGQHVQFVGVAVVLDEGPELLQAVQLAGLGVLQGLLLEVVVQLGAELALQAVAVVAEQAL